MSWLQRLWKGCVLLVIVLVGILPLQGAVVDFNLEVEQIRRFSRPYEFDYISWSISALGNKLTQSRLGVERFVDRERGSQVVLEYLALRNEVVSLQNQLRTTLSDPALDNRQQTADQIRSQLREKRQHKESLRPFVEQIIQDQMNTALASLRVSMGGQLLPPVLYQAEPDSYALIVSPRSEIRQAANIMLDPDISLDEMIALEEKIEKELDLSALVVGIGGVGLYPSMVIETGSLEWLLHVIGHEWTHNYLTIRPLGASYFSSPELTTINETIADLSADAIQHRMFELYYPAYLPDDLPPAQEDSLGEPPRLNFLHRKEQLLASQDFDFRQEMHQTRLVLDRLLAEGSIQEAEAYLEARRKFFWENGFQIRKLNQAYFAFHGSYAAQPGGAAGATGVDLGQQLRDLRENIDDYAQFMRTVAWRWRLDQFQELFSTRLQETDSG